MFDVSFRGCNPGNATMEGWRWRQKNTHELCDFRLLESCSHRDHLWSKRRGQKTNGWNLKIRLFQEKEKHPPKPAIFRFQIKLQGCKWVNSQFISYEGNQSWTCTICTVNQCFRQGRNPPWILQEKQQQQCWKMTVWIWKEDIHIQKQIDLIRMCSFSGCVKNADIQIKRVQEHISSSRLTKPKKDT